MQLNERATRLCERLMTEADDLRVEVSRAAGRPTLVDLGIDAEGGLAAGVALAEICLAGLARVALAPGNDDLWPGPAVSVWTDHPIAACLASQYAGWRVAEGKFFAMGSGPMRAAIGREELFDTIGLRERAEAAVGALETSQRPPDAVLDNLAELAGVAPEKLTVLVAPTASQAGTLQVVARSVETALHKLHELGFDLARVASGWGTAPLAPVAADGLAAIGRTNDAILYGGDVTLWVHGDDDSLRQLGPRVPSTASPDHGRPFAEIFARYDHDFYKIDGGLFSPAVVRFVNLDTGHVHRFGHTSPQVIHASFGQ